MANPSAVIRRAVRAEPTSGTHGPWRGGESDASWGLRRKSDLPLDVHDFLREEF